MSLVTKGLGRGQLILNGYGQVLTSVVPVSLEADTAVAKYVATMITAGDHLTASAQVEKHVATTITASDYLTVTVTAVKYVTTTINARGEE